VSGASQGTVIAADGRTIEFAVWGNGGVPLVFHHGTPGAPDHPAASVAAAVERGMRLVSYARPGYQGSTPLPGRDVASCAADVATVLDEIGADTFLGAGWSGGGPHALACSALLRERCLGTLCLAGIAPFDAEGLDWMAGMGEDNVTEFGAAAAGKQLLSEFLESVLPGFSTLTVDEVEASLRSLLASIDVAALTGDFGEFMVRSFRAALSGGIAGWRDDDLAFMKPWGFELAHTGPVTLWHGDQDRMVPVAHGAWLAKRLPKAEVQIRTGEGHLSLISAIGDLYDDLLRIAD
jgi:pimeloyl-ACP methyl ester carboxylesterase